MHTHTCYQREDILLEICMPRFYADTSREIPPRVFFSRSFSSTGSTHSVSECTVKFTMH